MSTLWCELDNGHWHPVTIGKALDGTALQSPGIRIVHFGQESESGVALLARPPAHVLVNGQPVLGGLRVLDHKDEVLASRRRFFYSAESAPVVVVFRRPPGARPVTCPVCRGVIHDGDAAVQCPNCSRWHHQIEPAEGRPGRRCWIFASHCRICTIQPTALSGEPAWRPEMEERHA
jgi:hypothetical protein